MPIRMLKKDKNESEPKKRFNPRTGEETNKPGKPPRTIYRPKPETPLQMRTGGSSGGRLSIGKYQNPNSERSKESIDRYVRGMRDKKYGGKRINTDRIRKFSKGMTPGQAKIAAKAPPPNKIDEKDFAVLRKEKAKGRGMGLQDEKVQPGKVIKAKDSKFIERRKILSNMSEFQKRRLKLESKKIGGVMKARKGKSAMVPLKKGYSKTLGVFPTINKVKPSVGGGGMGKGTDKVSTKKAEDFMKRRKKLAGSKLPGKIGTVLGIGSMMVPAAYAAMKQYKDYKSAKNRDKAKVKKMGGGMMKKYSSGGESSYTKGYEGRKTGKGVRESLKDKVTPMKKERLLAGLEASGKMSGGMMKKYSKGGGADSGRIGEMKSRIGVAMNKAKRLRSTDRLTDRDIEKAKSLVKGKMPKAIAQGKTKKVMIHDMMPADTAMRTGSPMPRYSKGGGHYDDKNKNVVKHIRIKKKMGGGMIGPSQRPGYSKGTMVKARGCKLGRTRPTKIT